MKIASCFLYVLLSVTYLKFTDGTIVWGGFNLITQLGFIGYLSYLGECNKNNTEIERLFFTYIKLLSIGNCVYIALCIYKGKYWSIYNTDIFAYILAIGFIVFLVHFALKRT